MILGQCKFKLWKMARLFTKLDANTRARLREWESYQSFRRGLTCFRTLSDLNFINLIILNAVTSQHSWNGLMNHDRSGESVRQFALCHYVIVYQQDLVISGCNFQETVIPVTLVGYVSLVILSHLPKKLLTLRASMHRLGKYNNLSLNALIA